MIDIKIVFACNYELEAKTNKKHGQKSAIHRGKPLLNVINPGLGFSQAHSLLKDE